MFSFASPYAKRIDSTSSKSPEQGSIRYSLKKWVTLLLRYLTSTQSNPISIIIICGVVSYRDNCVLKKLVKFGKIIVTIPKTL